MFGVENFLGTMRVSRKLTAGFALAIILMSVASIVGLLATRTSEARIESMLRVDAVLAAEGADMRAVLLELRVHEQDLILNAADPAKVTAAEAAWNARFAEQVATTNTVDKAATETADHELLAAVAKVHTAYATAFHKLVADVRAGSLATPQAASAAFAPISTQLEELDETITKFYESHEEAMVAQGQAIARSM